MPSFVSDWLTLEDAFRARMSVRRSLHQWAVLALGPLGQSPARHHTLLLSELEALTNGQFHRLMVLMPPGSAKSTYASILFPAWWFARNPSSSIVAASHTASLAQHFSRRVRDLIVRHADVLGYRISPMERAAAQWRTSLGGEYLAAGVKGAITGRRADLAIIDDPIKSQAAADSSTHRENLWNWYRSDLVTRLKPNARVILIMTRWHEDDLGGRLLGKTGHDWRVLRLPALAEQHDMLGRAEGEPLWPQWEGLASLAARRDLIGPRTWSALYQQTPRQATGTIFNITRATILEQAAATNDAVVIRAWDLAATIPTNGNNPDWTAGVKLSRDAQGYYTVLDVVRLRGSPREIEDAIRVTAERDGNRVWIGLPEDPGQAGKS